MLSQFSSSSSILIESRVGGGMEAAFTIYEATRVCLSRLGLGLTAGLLRLALLPLLLVLSSNALLLVAVGCRWL